MPVQHTQARCQSRTHKLIKQYRRIHIITKEYTIYPATERMHNGKEETVAGPDRT
jgi:hypothetical protein